jgi:hypothetical protein
MKFAHSLFFVSVILVSCLTAFDQKGNESNDPAWLAQTRGSGVVSTWLNPLATFNPSIISSGHAQYFGSIDELNYGQGKDFLKFVSELKNARLGIFLGELFCVFFGNAGVRLATFPLAALNLIYMVELKRFEDKCNKD